MLDRRFVNEGEWQLSRFQFCRKIPIVRFSCRRIFAGHSLHFASLAYKFYRKGSMLNKN